MYIIGAGMAGLLAAHYFRHRDPSILEAQPELPLNHEALLRFRSSTVGEITGVPFRSGTVRKSIVAFDTFTDKATPYLANLYSRKVTGRVMNRSIWSLDECTRFVAPPDLIRRMAKGLDINYFATVDDLDHIRKLAAEGPVISTIPMPMMMRIVGWRDVPAFESRPIWSIQAKIIDPPCDVFQTIYYPDPAVPQYRASITGDTLLVEFIREPPTIGEVLDRVVDDFGLGPVRWIGPEPLKKQRYGKINPINEDLRREFIYTMTREYGIYSLGRFATWRQILLDDVAKDCEVISKLIGAEARRLDYAHSLLTSR